MNELKELFYNSEIAYNSQVLELTNKEVSEKIQVKVQSLSNLSNWFGLFNFE